MRSILSRQESWLLFACLAMAGVAVLGPAIAAPGPAHGFADARTLLGIPHAMDVLSNLPFAIAGAWGFAALWRCPPRSVDNMQRAMASLFFAGLLLTAAASSWYHLRPDDAGLAIDRTGMSVAFAGVLGLLAAGRVSERAGATLGLAVLLVGPVAVHVWRSTGNLLPWAVVQFGGMLLVAWLAMAKRRPGALPITWLGVVVAYGIAKLFELQDHAILGWTGGMVSGHSLKHVVAALAAWPVISALRALAFSEQNGQTRPRLHRLEKA